MQRSSTISLIDNTRPPDPQSILEDELSQTQTDSTELSRHLSRRWTAQSIRSELAKRKYKKWQPGKLGLPGDTPSHSRNASLTPSRTPEGTRSPAKGKYRDVDGSGSTNGSLTPSRTPEGSKSPVKGKSRDQSAQRDVDTVDFATGEAGNGLVNGDGQPSEPELDESPTPNSELDILYENQRGWFFFGIPLYSHGSLLNFDPSAWTTKTYKDSPVNITNAQLPDPSWQWAWQTWYVDMSGDVDEQGWQYSLSFNSSAWHGSHPWFHSFVRRRRWVRLRVKKGFERSTRGRTGLEKAHMLNEDYFTIHPGKERKGSIAMSASLAASTSLSRATTAAEEVDALEEIPNIGTLMYALKIAIVDREKIDALRRFIRDGGEELYYLDEKMPVVLACFIFQTSRWQFLAYLLGVITDLSPQISSASGKEADELRLKRDNLSRAAETAKRHIGAPDLFDDGHRLSVTDMLDLMPVISTDDVPSKPSKKYIRSRDRRGKLKGISTKAEIGREGHIY